VSGFQHPTGAHRLSDIPSQQAVQLAPNLAQLSSLLTSATRTIYRDAVPVSGHAFADTDSSCGDRATDYLQGCGNLVPGA